LKNIEMLAVRDAPDNRERVTGTLVLALATGAAPKVNTGRTVTRLMPFSSANLIAAFSNSTFDTAYPCERHQCQSLPMPCSHRREVKLWSAEDVYVHTQVGGLLALRYSTSDQELSSSKCPPPGSGLLDTPASDDVRITRFTVPALAHDLNTFRVPSTAASIRSLCH
jgi:hypothetical protein